MDFKKYISESERAVVFPVTGDVLEVVIREDFDDEIAIDFPVVEHTEDSITFLTDEYAYNILDTNQYIGETCSLKCRDCGDMLGEPTTDCGYDSMDHKGDNWMIVDIDNDGDADIAIAKEDVADNLVKAIEKQGEFHKEKMHEDQKAIEESIKHYQLQADWYQRMGIPNDFYIRKVDELKQTLIEDVEEVEEMITRRIMNHPEFSDMVREFGIEQITQAIKDTAEFHGDDADEIGSSDVSAMVNDTIRSLKRVVEAEYKGRKVKLNKPMQGDVKKFKVYVKDPKTGNIKKVNFGHGGSSVKGKAMKIRKNNS